MKTTVGLLALLLLAVWAAVNFQVAVWIGGALIVLAVISWVLQRNGHNHPLWSPLLLFGIGCCFLIWFGIAYFALLPAHITGTPYVPVSPHP